MSQSSSHREDESAGQVLFYACIQTLIALVSTAVPFRANDFSALRLTPAILWWGMVVLSWVRYFRKRRGADLRLPNSPVVTWTLLLLLGGLLTGMAVVVTWGLWLVPSDSTGKAAARAPFAISALIAWGMVVFHWVWVARELRKGWRKRAGGVDPAGEHSGEGRNL